MQESDRVFLQRVQRQMKLGRLLGWVCVAIPVAVGLFTVCNAPRLVESAWRWSQQSTGPLQPIIESVEKENAELKALPTSTQTEAALVQRLIDKNARVTSVMAAQFLAIMACLLKFVLLQLLTVGTFLLVVVRRDRRFLRLIEESKHDSPIH